MSREKHEFQFTAAAIGTAAAREADYHRKRQQFWGQEYSVAMKQVRATVSIEVKTFPVTGGERADVAINYGDPAAYKRMTESFEKLHTHRRAAERFETEERIYRTQGERVYELSGDDVHYFRLGGEPRPE